MLPDKIVNHQRMPKMFFYNDSLQLQNAINERDKINQQNALLGLENEISFPLLHSSVLPPFLCRALLCRHSCKGEVCVDQKGCSASTRVTESGLLSLHSRHNQLIPVNKCVTMEGMRNSVGIKPLSSASAPAESRVKYFQWEGRPLPVPKCVISWG